MKFNDNITLDIAKSVSDVLEGKTKKEEVKYPHKMYHPKTGAEVTVNDKAGHDKYNKLGYTHTPTEVAQPQPKGEKEFKGMHDVEVSGEAPDGKVTKAKKGNYYKEAASEVVKEDMAAMQYVFDNQQILTKFINLIKPIKDLDVRSQDKLPGGKRVVTVHASKIALAKLHKVFTKLQNGDVSEESTPTGPAKEESEKQKKYQAFFNKALKKFGIKSPAELEGDKKKEFFDYVDANYEADDEPEEGVKEEVDKLAQKKYANMKAKIGVIQNNIAKTKNNKFRMRNDGQERIDSWNKDIDRLRDIMKKMVDKFGSGVASGEAGFTGGN